MNNFLSSFGKSFAPYVRKAIEPDNSLADNTPVAHSDCFKIVVILDESGSMQSIKSDMVNSLNNIIAEQKQIKERPCKFTLVKFNDKVTRVIKNRDLREVSPLKSTDYTPSRTTALYDAIGDSCNWFRYESDVLMIIVTDGAENASKKYSHKQITEMMDEKKKHRNWTYVYLSNDLSTKAQGDNLGLRESRAVSNCVVSQNNYGDFLGNRVNAAISNYRTKGVSVQSQLNK